MLPDRAAGAAIDHLVAFDQFHHGAGGTSEILGEIHHPLHESCQLGSLIGDEGLCLQQALEQPGEPISAGDRSITRLSRGEKFAGIAGES